MSQLSSADRVFDEALNRSHRDDYALIGKSECLRRTRQTDQAIELLTGRSLGAMTVRRAVALSRLRCERAEYDEARKVLQQLRRSEVSLDERVVVAVATVDIAQEKHGCAATRLEEVVKRSPRANLAKHCLAWCLTALCDSDDADHKYGRQQVQRWRTQAENLCRELNQDDPYLTGPYFCRARIAKQRHLPWVAESLLLEARKRDDFSGYELFLADVYLDVGRYDQAEELVRHALGRDWYEECLHLQLARLLSEVGRVKEAVQELHCAKGIEVSADRILIVQRLATTLVNADRCAEAEREIAEALKSLSSEDVAKLSSTRAFILLKLTESSGAVRRAELARVVREIEELPEPPDASYELHYYRGIAHLELAKVSDTCRRVHLLLRARDDFGRCNESYRSSHYIDHPDARRALDELNEIFSDTKQLMPFILFATAGTMLVALWVAFMLSHGELMDSVMLEVFTPMLMAFGLLALLTLALMSFKVGAVEAKVRQPEPDVERVKASLFAPRAERHAILNERLGDDLELLDPELTTSLAGRPHGRDIIRDVRELALTSMEVTYEVSVATKKIEGSSYYTP